MRIRERALDQARQRPGFIHYLVKRGRRAVRHVFRDLTDAAAFPLGGIAIVAFAIIDFLLPKRFKEVGSQSH
jgi:hypothetical protein